MFPDFEEENEEYVTDETDLDLDEDFNPNDFGDLWHPDVADTLEFSY